jgi:putative membrane protein
MIVPKIAFVCVAVVAIAHLYFMYKEMCRWESFSVDVARLPPDVAKATIAIGRNQGLYNGFLAAGLIWSLFAPASFNPWLAGFFLACVLVAGVFGEFTIKPRKRALLLFQALPAAVALFFLWWSKGAILPPW